MQNMRRRTRQTIHRFIPERAGAALVEGAVIVTVLFLTLCAMLDLTLAVLHYNSLSEAARRVTRAAIVHGDNAPSAFGVWGPETYSATANDDSNIAATSRSVLVALDPASVEILVEWPDGENQLNDRVRVSIAHDYSPLFTCGAVDGTITLSATSTMRIAH